MSLVNKTIQTTNAQALRDEVVPKANTKQRVYDLIKNLIDSSLFWDQVQQVTGISTTNVMSQKAVTDAIAEAINKALSQKWKTSVKAATTGALPANTQVGVTLVGNVNGAFPALDTIAISLNDSVLIKNETEANKHGIYTLTQVGDAGTPWILQRRADASTAEELESASVPVEQGTSSISGGNADTTWRQTSDNIVLGTTAINWVNMGGSSTPDWDDVTKGKVERAIQAEAETAADATLNNRDNTRGLTARSFRWAFDAVWAWMKGQAQNITGVWTVPTASPGTNNGQVASTEFVRQQIIPFASTGSEIFFDRCRTYGSFGSPIVATTLTENNTGAELEVIQKIYHQAASFTPPASWTKRKQSADYVAGVVNVIYVCYVSSTRKEYSITQDA